MVTRAHEQPKEHPQQHIYRLESFVNVDKINENTN